MTRKEGARRRPRVLAVLPDHPHPPDMGSRVRNLRILETLSRDFELSIVTLVHDPGHLADPGPVAELGRWTPVLAPHRRGPLHRAVWHLRGRIAAHREGLHRETYFQSFPHLARAVAGEVGAFRPDLVHVAYWYALRHLRDRPRPPLWVVDTHDVQFERQERLWARYEPREKKAELEELRRYDRIIAITGHDRETFRRELGNVPPCEVVGMGVDPAEWDPRRVRPARPSGPRVVFYGNLQTESNQEAARHLLVDLLPGMPERVPGLEVVLLGAGPPASLIELARHAPCPVEVTGFVDDVRPHLASARVIALSLPAGSGQRGRVVEAAMLGVPVVGYPGGLEGLELEEGEGLRVAPEPELFRERMVELLLDPERAAALGRAGREAAIRAYGPEQTYGRFPRLYREWMA